MMALSQYLIWQHIFDRKSLTLRSPFQMEMTIQSYFSSSLAMNEEDLCSLEAWIPCLFYHGELVDFEKIKSHHTLMLFMRLHLGKRSKSQALFLKKKFMGLVFGWNMEQWWLGWENPWGLDIESVWEYWNYSKTFNIIPPPLLVH